MHEDFLKFLKSETEYLNESGLFRKELSIRSAQGPTVIGDGGHFLNLGSSDYLGLANRSGMKKAVKLTVDQYGVGLASTRMFAGTQTIHLQLEEVIAQWAGAERALVFASPYHANTGLFEALFDSRDTLFVDVTASPALGMGIRLCEAKTLPFSANGLEELEDRLQRSRSARFRAIVTSGISPLDGSVAPLRKLCDLGDTYDALVIVDDTDSFGVMGETGRGAAEHCGVLDRVDVITGSLEHALGAGGGGYLCGRSEIIDWLRQKSRSYLVSSAPAPAVVGAALHALESLKEEGPRLQRLRANVAFFRESLRNLGLRVLEGEHPMVAIHTGDARTTQSITNALFEQSIYLVGICPPIVPEGQARLRAQVSVMHSQKMLTDVANAIATTAREHGILPTA